MTAQDIAGILARESGIEPAEAVIEGLAKYLALLARWNARTNVSAIREPAAMVQRHFGESLQCAAALPEGVETLLDYGSGGGFPGAVIALARPGLKVTLAESQGKKAAFLQEVCRTLGLTASVYAKRVEEMDAAKRFDVVTLRAVDRMEQACKEASRRVKAGGWMVLMTTEEGLQALGAALDGSDRTIHWEKVPIRGTVQGIVALGHFPKD